MHQPSEGEPAESPSALFPTLYFPVVSPHVDTDGTRKRSPLLEESLTKHTDQQKLAGLVWGDPLW